MIANADLANTVRDIQRAHYHDGDGGYAAVEAIRALWQRLTPDKQKHLKAALVDFVCSREPSLWSLAWEALVQEEAQDVAPIVFKALRSERFDSEWRDEVVLGLLRLGHKADPGYYRDYLVNRWRQDKTLVLPLVAALARVDPDSSIELATSYLVQALSLRVAEPVGGYIPTFVRHYLAVDEHLLARLATELKARMPAAAIWFAGALNEYLAKPWMLEELGDKHSESLRAEIRAAAELTN